LQDALHSTLTLLQTLIVCQINDIDFNLIQLQSITTLICQKVNLFNINQISNFKKIQNLSLIDCKFSLNEMKNLKKTMPRLKITIKDSHDGSISYKYRAIRR